MGWRLLSRHLATLLVALLGLLLLVFLITHIADFYVVNKTVDVSKAEKMMPSEPQPQEQPPPGGKLSPTGTERADLPQKG